MSRALVVGLVWFAAVYGLQAEPGSKTEKPPVSSAESPDWKTAWQTSAVDRAKARGQVKELLKKPLTVTAAVQIALLNNRELQAAFEEAGIAGADVMEAVTLPNPRVDFDALIPNVSGEAVKYSWNVAEDFVQVLMLPLKSRMAREQLEAVELGLADETLGLMEKVKKSYCQVQAGQQLLSRLALVQQTNAATLELTQKQYQAGNITELRLLMVQAAYSQGRLDLAGAESELRANRESLNQLLGLWGSEIQWKIVGDLPAPPRSDPPMDHLETLAVSQRTDLKAAHRNLSSIVAALGLSKTYRWFPVIDVGFAGERETDDSLLLGPSLAFEIPIFNQGQPRIAKGESEMRKAENQFEALAVEIRSETRTLRDKLQAARESARFYHDELLPTRIKIVNQATLQYNAMQLGAYELFGIKAEELQAERGYIEALQNYWMTRASLERAVGGSLVAVPKKESAPPEKDSRPAEKAGPRKSSSRSKP